MSGAFQAAGTHLLADLHGMPAGPLHDVSAIEALLRGAAEAAGARILHGHFHAFGPEQGVTGVLLLAESHISIHTWPEAGFAAVDIFMCGAARPQLALEHIERTLCPRTKQVRAVARGLA